MFYQKFEYVGFENFRNRRSVVERFLKFVSYIFLIRILLNLILPFVGYEDLRSFERETLCLASNFDILMKKPWTIVTYIFTEKSILDFIIDLILVKVLSKIFLMQSTERKYLGVIILGTIFSGILMITGFSVLPKLKGLVQYGIGLDPVVYSLIGAVVALTPSFPLSIFLFGRIKLSHFLWIAILNALYKLDYKSAQALLQLGGIVVGYIYGYFIQSGYMMVVSKKRFSGLN